MNYKIKALIPIIASIWALQINKADAGACAPQYQAPEFSFDFIKEYHNPLEAPAVGTLLTNAYTWNLGRNYSTVCDCNGQSELAAVRYYTTTTTLPEGEKLRIDGEDIQFYRISPYVQAGTLIYMAGGRQYHIATPWHKISNLDKSASDQCNRGTVLFHNTATGSKGRLHLLISRRFAGTLHLPRFLLLSLYGANEHADSPLVTPIMKLYMSLSVTVPQSCTLAEGQHTTFDFGTLSPADVASPNEAAKNVVSRSFWIKCSNIDSSVKINLSLEGQPSRSPFYLSSSHPDVALGLTSNGRRVFPTQPGLAPTGLQLIPFQYYPQFQGGELKLEAWPVRMQPLPAPGAFQGSATIRFDYE